MTPTIDNASLALRPVHTDSLTIGRADIEFSRPPRCSARAPQKVIQGDKQ